MDDNSGVTTTILGLALIAGLCGMSGCYIVERTKCKAMEAGLVEAEVPGVNVRVWTKPKP